MSTGIETVDIVEPWIYSTLSGDSTLSAMVNGQIIGAITPDNMVGPYVTFALSSPRDIRGVGTARIMVDTLYIVKAIAQTTSQSDVGPIAKRIDLLLDGKRATTGAGSLICARRNIIGYPELVQGIPYLHLGGLYNIVAHSG